MTENDYVATATAEKRLREVMDQRFETWSPTAAKDIADALLAGAEITYLPRKKSVSIVLRVPATAGSKPIGDTVHRLGEQLPDCPKILAGEQCWCGGSVGPRAPGDEIGVGCLADIAHNWKAASAESQALMESEPPIANQNGDPMYGEQVSIPVPHQQARFGLFTPTSTDESDYFTE